MKVLLHIGPGKTGSSSIQRALLTNADALKEVGICSLSHLRSPDGDHHAIAEAVRVPTAVRELQSLLVREISDLAQQEFKSVIVSSDLFANLSAQHVSEFAQLLRQATTEVSVVFFVRNLYEIAVGTLQQQIRNGKHISSVHAYRPYGYFRTLYAYWQGFGEAALVAVDYERNTDLLGKMLSACGMSAPQLAVANVNESVARNQLRLINYCNKYLTYPDTNGERTASLLRWAIMNLPRDGALSLSIFEQECLREHFKYDAQLLSDALPNFASKLTAAYALPSFSEPLSFDDTVCGRPELDEIMGLFSVLEANRASPHLKRFFV